jgi:sigma-B regulation protein RsbU (phosphoserine phosphatase)
MLLRCDGRVERLEAGGPVIGLMEGVPFLEASVAVESGDLLLGYTDGVSECMNPRDEEWGDDKLLALLRANRHLPSADLVDLIMKDADLFANGAKQHDDMTLILMKVA